MAGLRRGPAGRAIRRLACQIDLPEEGWRVGNVLPEMGPVESVLGTNRLPQDRLTGCGGRAGPVAVTNGTASELVKGLTLELGTSISDFIARIV
jgi:hypothetical protein